MIAPAGTVFISLVLFGLTGCSATPESIAESGPTLLLEACPKPKLAGAISLVAESRCGVLEVWEDRQAQSGRRIALKVMVLPAINPTALPDPIFFLSGGPGSAASEVGPAQFRSLGKVRKDRDVVFVDQRGTGSSHPLDCVMDSSIFEEEVTQRHITDVQAQRMRECMEEFDADLTLYTTPIAMDDLDEVREALGYDRINLIGGSYGTRAALVYMRRHPESVRAAVLDGVVPFEMQLPRYMGRDAERALELMLTDCERDDACRAAFPSGLGERKIASVTFALSKSFASRACPWICVLLQTGRLHCATNALVPSTFRFGSSGFAAPIGPQSSVGSMVLL